LKIESPREADARARLAALVSSGRPMEIVEASLVVASGEYPGLDIDHHRRRIDALGDAAAKRVEGIDNPFARLDALRVYLFEEQGFRGNVSDYYDPRNSYLNEVLDRRLGIPLTLSIVTMEVAGRCGFDARGVGLPGHFVLRLDSGRRSLLIDPFTGGSVITEEDCRDLVTRATGKPDLFRSELLEGVSAESMLTRLLGNLKQIHLTREDHARALAIVEMLRVVRPDDASELRDRGFLMARLGHPGTALVDLEAYLELAPDAADAPAVRTRLAWLRRRVTEVN
jgi:regulator of sirC expression with transglutaminase-like and TPR domain